MAGTSMKPVSVLKKFFGLKTGQKLTDFAAEVRELKSADENGYNEMIDLAAIELGVEVDRSS